MSRVLIRVGPGAWKQPPWERSAPACHVPDAWKQELQVPVAGTRYSKILERRKHYRRCWKYGGSSFARTSRLRCGLTANRLDCIIGVLLQDGVHTIPSSRR